MSLDVSLNLKYQKSYDNGKTWTNETECVFDYNITHNLTTMADVAGIYIELWRPEDKGITTAGQLIPKLKKGLEELKHNPEKYKKYNSPNGWGMYEHLLTFVDKYLQKCIEYPNATIWVSR